MLQKSLLSLALVSAVAPAVRAQVQAVDEAAFSACVAADAKVEKLAGDFKFTEGPTWVGGADGFLVFSDIPANELKKWTAKDGVSTFRTPSANTNGNTTDLDGRLVSAEHSGRRISVTEKDGSVKALVEKADGKKFNSPNDVVVKSDGTVWFTDPPYGTPKGEAKEQAGNYTFRFDPKSGAVAIVSKDQDMPNGLAFSPDETKLYIADSGRPRKIRVYDVKADGTLGEGKDFASIDKGGPDGIRVDHDGRVWSSSGDGVQVFDTAGKLIGRIVCPESGANLAFGGADGKTLFITARTGLYAVKTKVTGAKRP